MIYKGDIATETEVTLLICAEQPRALADEIARLKRIGFFRLGATSSSTIRDVYLDTRAGTLSTKRWALRLRTVGARRSITLKGPSRLSGRGDARRLELEAPWSYEAIERIRDELSGRGMVLGEPAYRHDDPEKTMASMGLEPLQRRKIVRRKRAILGVHDRSGPVEFMVDAVTFLFAEAPIVHWELEIEVGSPEARDTAESVAQELLDMYEPALRTWNYGKLATGLVLEDLVRSGEMESLVREDGSLIPAAYEAVEQRLQSSGKG